MLAKWIWIQSWVPLLIRYLPSALSSFLYFTFSFNMVLWVLESFHAADDEEPGDSDLDSVVRSRNANCKELKTSLHTILDMWVVDLWLSPKGAKERLSLLCVFHQGASSSPSCAAHKFCVFVIGLSDNQIMVCKVAAVYRGVQSSWRKNTYNRCGLWWKQGPKVLLH